MFRYVCLMLDHWFYEIPEDPLLDLRRMVTGTSRDHRLKIINGIDPRSNVPMKWSPLQLALTWPRSNTMMETVEELVLMGADVNRVSLCGLNPLHLLIFLLMFRISSSHREEMLFLEWWISKGVDVHTSCILKDEKDNQYHILSALDLLVHLVTKSFHVLPSIYLPSYVHFSNHPHKKNVKRILALLLCFGATVSKPSLVIDHVLTWLQTNPLGSYSFLRDYTEVRLKLPRHGTVRHLQRRLRLLQQHAASIDVEQATHERKKRYAANNQASYSNPYFESKGEFMPYEFLGYTDGTDKQYYFHKSMIPSILQSQENPFTRTSIPVSVLRQWFHGMSQRPYCFSLTMLRDSVVDGRLVLWDDPVQGTSIHHFALHFIHGMLSINFPYTNILSVTSLSSAELRYVCHVLSKDPYELDVFQTRPLEDDWLVYFLKQSLRYVLTKSSAMDLLYFGLEDALQDISSFHLVQKILNDSTMSFRDSFVDVIMNLPAVGDIIRDRLGYVHLGYFHEIWKRFVVLSENFS